MGIHSNERQDKIFSMLESRGKMSVSDLAEYFQVTETTIRRDLITMEENQQIVRRRGFAELPLQFNSGLRRRNTFQEEKQRIARKAVELINYGTTLALDSGTSVAELVHVLADEGRDMGIDIITASIQTASETCRFFRTSMPGGYVFPDEVSIGGMSAVRFLEGVTFPGYHRYLQYQGPDGFLPPDDGREAGAAVQRQQEDRTGGFLQVPEPGHLHLLLLPGAGHPDHCPHRGKRSRAG